MFDYCGDFRASLSDYRDLLDTVIKELFPTAQFIVRVQQTKAMRVPRISISVSYGPDNEALINAIPMLSELNTGAQWAYCGKILPRLGFSVRSKAGSLRSALEAVVWAGVEEEFGQSRFIKLRGGRLRWNPALVRQYEERFSAICRRNHPLQNSPTLALIDRGHAATIERIAVEQRRAYLERATPEALIGGGGQRNAQRRNRL